jgi:hypothetical protein
MATKRKSAKKKSARGGKKKGRSARKGAGKRATARKGGGKRASARRGASKKKSSMAKRRRPATKKRSRGQAAVARVKRVTREVVQQASGAVSAGVESLKDLGENLADRVPDRFKTPF